MPEAVIIDGVRTTIGDPLLISAEKAKELRLKPLAQVIASAAAGVPPRTKKKRPSPDWLHYA